LIDSKKNILKIADFGLSKFIHCRDSEISNEIQSLAFRAPEVLMGSLEYSETIDQWAAGSVIYKIMTGQCLFTEQSEIGTIFQIFLLMGAPTLKDWP
jgi:serine/threonine protein kinase